MNILGMIDSRINTDKRIKLPRMVDISSILFCGYMLFGSTSSNYLYISLALFGVWLIVASLKKPNLISYYITDKKNLFFIIVALYGFICGLIYGDFVYLIKQVGAAFLLYSPIIVFNYYKDESTPRIKFFIIVMGLLWVFVAIKAIYFYSVNIGSAKYIAMDSSIYGDVTLGGGMLLGYGSAIAGCVMIDLFFRTKHKIVIFLLILLMSLLLFKIESTVTLLCFIAGVFFSIIGAQRYRNSGLKLFWYVLILILISFLLFSISSIGKVIVDFGNGLNSVFGSRIASFGATLIGDSKGGEYAIDRATIMLESIHTFLEEPLFGVAYKHGNGYLGVESFGVGNHCAWFDFFANYGLFFGSLSIMPYIMQIKELKKQGTNILSFGWIICLLLMGCFNPIKGWQPHFILFCILPIICELNSRKEVFVR